MEVHRCRLPAEQGVPAFRELLLLLPHRRSRVPGKDYHGAIHPQSHPPHHRELRNCGGQQVPLKYCLQLHVRKLEALRPGWDPQDLPRVFCYYVHVPEFWVDFDGTFSLSPHPALHCI